ncbi:DUF6291 domain-containing protein [Porcipelethomonas sp.]|uniref:DUF6291 domain-containing protein n=1 Tax=Porcipelethomonas sp. TaxID=2981675 RepID=UPI003EFB3082
MSKDYHTENKSFAIYKDWEELFDALEDNEVSQLIKALFAFAKRGEEAEFSGALKIAFITMKNAIERDGRKWEQKCKSNSRNAKKRWSKDSDEYERIQTCTNYTDKDTDTDTDIDTDIDKDKEIDIDNIPPISPKGDKPEIKPETDSFSESFNDFWKAYPKKVSKANALKAWNKLKPNGDLVREILSALERQKTSVQWQKDNGQFIPYPATWLNGRRWEDEQQAVSAMPDYSYGTEGVDYL